MPKHKPTYYTLFLRFEDFDKLWKFYELHLPQDCDLFEAHALDQEMKGIGRAPKGSVVLRPRSENRTIGGPLRAKIVEDR